MGMFEYVTVLSSIIIGLGITHLLQGTVRLVQQPEEGRFYWLHLVWVDVGDTWLKGGAYVASLGPEWVASRGLKMALCVIAIRSRNERFHATFGVANLLYQVSFVLRHYDTVV